MALPTISSRPTKTSGGFVSKWNAAHNPIVYKFSEDKWPANTADSSDNITAHADDYGNVQFTIAGHSYSPREWVTIASSDIDSYNGVWQILSTETNTITLDLPYEAGTLGSPTALKYYRAYHMLVEVYAGIPAGHALAASDPIAFVATIKAVPNADNEVLVDVAELVREHIFMLNDIDDNDINLWTEFYVKYAESYDDVTGTYPDDEIVQFISTYTDDVANTFLAVQAKMPFQNTYGANMLEWIVASNHQGKFLTKFERPVLWKNIFFDIAVAIDSSVASPALDYEEFTEAGVSLGTGSFNLASEDEGIYRIQLDDIAFNASTAYIEAYVDGGSDTEVITIDVREECNTREGIHLTWLNNLGGFDHWFFEAYHSRGIEFEEAERYKKNVFENWDTNFINGETVESFNRIEAYQNIRVRSQLLTKEQVQGISYVKTSPLVQIFNDTMGNDKTTVVVDKRDFTVYEEEDQLYTIDFSLRFTAMLPIQNA